MTPIDAFHLPGLEPGDVERWDIREYGAAHVAMRFPVLREGAISRQAARLLEARRQSLEGRPPADIARVIGRAAARLADRADPLRITLDQTLPAVTGYSPAMITLGLDRMARDWSEPALLALLASELAGGRALDAFLPRPDGRRVRAVGPRLAWHVFAGNVPGVAVTSLIRSLLVRAATLGKTASGEPLLTIMFARALESVDPALAATLALTHWPGGGSLLEAEALAVADLVVVYGGEEAVRSIRARTPAGTRIVEHGPRLSAGLIGRDALASIATAKETATRAAWAVSIFDQQGCVSPHLFWIERGGAVEPRAFAELLGRALELVARDLPRGSITAAEAAAIHDARTAAEFRAIAGEEVLVLEGAGASWTVILDPEPGLEPSCLNRLVRVKPVADLAEVPKLIEPARGWIQTLGVEGAGERTANLALALSAAGATRITDFARMPWPGPTSHHDGDGPLAELVQWVGLEV